MGVHTYTVDSKFGRGARDLYFRWKGSIFKLVWPDLSVFLILYFTISFLYRFGLGPEHQRFFVKIALYCEKYGTLIPVSFVLGFYVSLVIGRWWAQYKLIPWIDNFAILVNSTIIGHGDEDRLLRRTVCRYVCLAITQCFTLISIKTKKRFPTLDHFIDAGLLLDHEKRKIEDVVASLPKYETQWIPLVWASGIIAKARVDGKIVSDTFVKMLIGEINKIQDQCILLLSFDRIRVPLVYTQVVTFAVYSYFLSCLMGRQWIPQNETDFLGIKDLDLVIPTFTILQFLFYMGWLKVAESLVSPFGDDDYAFELNWLVDRHLQVAFTIVDKMHLDQIPEMTKDVYWNQVVPPELPHTLASFKGNQQPPKTSTANVVMSKQESQIVNPDSQGIVIKTDIFWNRKGNNKNKSVELGINKGDDEEAINLNDLSL